ncbi:hypothetical protein [Ramlibacter sp.]|uniref:hypothetical protein n=1 Tax=Ramlibacter sp. TaxID=1917967 RepID=UPI002BDA92C1|nr:hypothetical protein [Ramlibacter sp.]HWI81906.1 hypothetical protein [Ramlibacter sp.]
MKTRITTIGSGLLLAALALTSAHAQDKAAKLVTRDQLRVCMNSESDLASRRQALDARNKKNGEEAAAIRAEAEELTEESKRADERPLGRDRFERHVRAHNARVAAAKTGVEALRADLEALNKSLVAHNEQCGGISYLPEDKEAILKEREAAKK